MSIQATIYKQIQVETANQPGMAAQLASVISKDAHANIQALWSGIVNGKGYFGIITDNNQKVSQALQQRSEFNKVKESDVLVVPASNRTSAYAEAAQKIANAGINIEYLYTTTLDNQPVLIISTANNQKAAQLFN